MRHSKGRRAMGALVALTLLFSMVGAALACHVAQAILPAIPPVPPVELTVWPVFGHDARHTGRTLNLGPQTNDLKWSFTTGDAIEAPPVINSTDGTIYVGSLDGRLYALNFDGTLKWFYVMGAPIRAAAAIALDGTIYAGSDEGTLYALNPNGTLKWSCVVRGRTPVSSSPTVGADGTIYVTCGDRLWAISAAGILRWSFASSAGEEVATSPAIGTDGTIYVGSDDSFLYALNPNGTQKWSYRLGDPIVDAPTVGADGTIYVGSSFTELWAFTSDGVLRWCCRRSGGTASSPAVASDGTIYIASGLGTLDAFNPSGTLRWSCSTGAPVTSSPAIGGDGIVYVGCHDYKLYAINPEGTVKWSYKTGAAVTSSPAIGRDETLYVGSLDRKLYAIGLCTLRFETVPATSGAVAFDSVSYSHGNTASKAAGTYAIAAHPAAGCAFARWETTGGIAVGDAAAALATCKVTGSGTLRMVQSAILTYTITASAGTGGTITPSGSISVASGSSQAFTFTPSTGYRIADLLVDGVSAGPFGTYTFAHVTADHTIAAVFAKAVPEGTVIILHIGSPTFTVNGSPRTLDSPPVIRNSRTLLPIRAVVEAMGGSVAWDNTSRKVTIALGGTSVQLWIGKATALVNGVTMPIDPDNARVVPEILYARTMLPLRFVAESLGATVEWDGATGTVTITYR